MSGMWRQKYCPKCYSYVCQLITNWDNEGFFPYCNELMKLVIFEKLDIVKIKAQKL